MTSLERDLRRSLAVTSGKRDPMLPTDEQLARVHEDLDLLLGRVRFVPAGAR